MSPSHTEEHHITDQKSSEGKSSSLSSHSASLLQVGGGRREREWLQKARDLSTWFVRVAFC